MQAKRIFFICMSFLLLIVATALCQGEVLLEFNFKKGSICRYEGVIEITDVGGIPTEGNDAGDESKALTFYDFSVPFIYTEEVIDVDSKGVATIRSVRNIDIEHFKSFGRDKTTIETVRACLNFFKLKGHSEWSARNKKNGEIIDNPQENIYIGTDIPLFPDEMTKVGATKQKILNTSAGFLLRYFGNSKNLKPVKTGSLL